MAVQPRFGAQLFGTVLDITEVFDLHLITAARSDPDIIKLLGFFYLPDRADAGFLLAFVDAPARKFHILDP